MVRAFLVNLLGLRPGETHRVGSMFVLLGLIITTSYIVKPVRNSLFLSQYGADRLPYVYIVVAIAMLFLAAGFTRWATRWYVQRIFVAAALFFATNLVFFWWSVGRGVGGFLLYVWVSAFTILMPSLFWLYANYIFYSNEGRRLFGILTAGGLLGSILGGGAASLMVPYTGTAGLLLVAGAAQVAVAGLVVWIEHQEKERISERRLDLKRQELRRFAQPSQSAFLLIARSPYLRTILALTVITTVTSTLVDFQFNVVAERSYRGMDALTGFFGTFFAWIHAFAFLLQLFLAGRLLSSLGVGAGLLILPLALFSGSLAFLLLPGLWTAAAVKASDDGLSNSLNKSSVEVLWLPISLEVKTRAKAGLDIVAERASRGVGGVALLVATTVFSLSVSQMSLLVVALVVPWILLAVRLKADYVRAFRTSLGRRDIDISALTADVNDQQSLSVLRQVLSGTDERQILYALDLLRGSGDRTLMELVVRLVSHPSSSVRSAALRHLRNATHPTVIDGLPNLVGDDDAKVGGEALALVLKHDPETGRKILRSLLESGSASRVHALLDALEDSPDLLHGILNGDFVRRYSQAGNDEEREMAAHASRFVTASEDIVDRVCSLLDDPVTGVARAAARSAGRLRHERFLPALTEQLRRRPLQASVREALSRYGPMAADRLVRLVEDERQDPGLRRALPRVLVEFDQPELVAVLLSQIPDNDLPFHYQAVKALGKMRDRHPELRFPAAEVDRVLAFEGELYCSLAGKLRRIGAVDSPDGSRALLVRVLEERLEYTRERIFRLMGLVYAPSDMFNVWHRLVHGRPAVRSAALEFLGNVLETRHRETLLPILEASTWEEIHIRGQRLFGTPFLSFPDAAIDLIRGTDTWLAACAVTLVGEIALTQAREAVRSVADHPDPVVREAARAVLNRPTADPSPKAHSPPRPG